MADRLTNVTPEELFEKNIVYHRGCYSETANVEKLERAKRRYSDSVEYGDSSVVKIKAGRASMSSFPNFQKETLTTRSMSSFFDKALCIICQCPGGILNCVEFKATVHNMLDVSSKLPGKTFFRRLKSISIAENVVTNDVIYHNLCWAKAKKKAVPKQKPTENYIKTLSNVEILNHIENSLVDNSIEFLDMNKLNEVYKKIFAENGENPGKISSNYKKQLKELVEENLPKICSVPSNQKNEPEKLTTKLTQAEAVKLYEKELSDALDGRLLSKLAKKIIGQFGQQI